MTFEERWKELECRADQQVRVCSVFAWCWTLFVVLLVVTLIAGRICIFS